MKNKYILGIDTSNYKTSVAVTDDKNNIICDQRVFLKVKQGEKGLRQSDALFQHIRNMPYLINEAMKAIAGQLAAVSFSDRPRPVEGSYMPVFLAGESFGKTIAASLDIPYISFSHQEGHIEAVKAFSAHKDKDRLLACHFSGGTCEVLSIREKNGRYEIKIVGGSKDISFGQVIDRAGVKLGMSFPAGEEMDITAVEASYATDLLTPVKVREGKINLSGIDTQFQRLADNLKYEDRDHLIRELMEKIADAMSLLIWQCSEITGIKDVLMTGGVTSSRFIRARMTDAFRCCGIDAAFDDMDLAQDNAVGIALLGGKNL